MVVMLRIAGTAAVAGVEEISSNARMPSNR